MPSLSVKAAAEMLRKPAYEQSRILAEQKYPNEGAQPFKKPYYEPAITGIRRFYKAGKSPSEIVNARAKIASLRQESKRINNNRALDQFLESELSSKDLEINKCPVFKAQIGEVEFRFSPQIRCSGEEGSCFLFLHCPKEPIDPEIARLALEISHWILEQNGENVAMSELKFFDLPTKTLISYPKRRKRSIDLLKENSKIIEALWNSI